MKPAWDKIADACLGITLIIMLASVCVAMLVGVTFMVKEFVRAW